MCVLSDGQKGREPSYITHWGFGGQPGCSGMLLLPRPPNLSFSGLESGTLTLAAHRPPARSATVLAGNRLSLKSQTDYCIPPTERLVCCCFLSFNVYKPQKSVLSVHPRSGIWGSARPVLMLVLCLCLSPMPLPCDLISLWKLNSRNRIFVPWEKVMF